LARAGGAEAPESHRPRAQPWFRSYVTSLLQRDVRDLANIEGLTDMPRQLGLLAARSAALMNMSEVSRAVGIAHSTLRRDLARLEATFILQPLPAWPINIGKRLVRSPRIHLGTANREALGIRLTSTRPSHACSVHRIPAHRPPCQEKRFRRDPRDRRGFAKPQCPVG
jgi:hypothetical protein